MDDQAGSTPPGKLTDGATFQDASMQAEAGPQQPRTAPIAIWALVLSIFGVCIFPLGLVAVVLGIIALVKINKDPALTGTGMAIASISLIAVSFVMAGIMAALAVPAFVTYVKRSKSAEATAQLSAIYNALDARRAGGGELVFVPVTPAEIPCGEKHIWTAADRARLAELDVPLPDASYYSYEVVDATQLNDPELAGTSALIRAHGDLDCDGKTSLFELAVAIDEDGQLYRAQGYYIVDELE